MVITHAFLLLDVVINFILLLIVTNFIQYTKTIDIARVGSISY